MQLYFNRVGDSLKHEFLLIPLTSEGEFFFTSRAGLVVPFVGKEQKKTFG